MQKPEFYGAVYALIENDAWEMLFVKRKNTGYLDGWYGYPAWHIEEWETLKEAMQREIREEIGLEIPESDLELVHMCHRIDPTDRTYFDCYFRVKQFHGTPINAEPEKSEWVFWIDWNNEELILYKPILEKISAGAYFSEIKNLEIIF